MARDLTRKQAMSLAKELFGDRAFARKKTKTAPGARRQIGMRGTVPPFRVTVFAAGRTWAEAFDAARAFAEKNGGVA